MYKVARKAAYFFGSKLALTAEPLLAYRGER